MTPYFKNNEIISSAFFFSLILCSGFFFFFFFFLFISFLFSLFPAIFRTLSLALFSMHLHSSQFWFVKWEKSNTFRFFWRMNFFQKRLLLRCFCTSNISIQVPFMHSFRFQSLTSWAHAQIYLASAHITPQYVFCATTTEKKESQFQSAHHLRWFLAGESHTLLQAAYMSM